MTWIRLQRIFNQTLSLFFPFARLLLLFSRSLGLSVFSYVLIIIFVVLLFCYSSPSSILFRLPSSLLHFFTTAYSYKISCSIFFPINVMTKYLYEINGMNSGDIFFSLSLTCRNYPLRFGFDWRSREK